jgi:hypothetical protein
MYSAKARERETRERVRDRKKRVEGRERGEIQFLKRNFIAHF